MMMPGSVLCAGEQGREDRPILQVESGRPDEAGAGYAEAIEAGEDEREDHENTWKLVYRI